MIRSVFSALGMLIRVILALGLVALLVEGARRVARNRNSVQSMAALVLFTLAIEAMFNPLQWVVQAGEDKRFNRREYNAGQMLAILAGIA